MSRELDRDEIDSREGRSQGRGGSEASEATRERVEVPVRKRTHRLSGVEYETLRDVGRFRTLSEDDVLRFRYQGNGGEMRNDYLNLKSQRLIERKTLSVGSKREAVAFWTLTKQGKQLVKHGAAGNAGQAIYAGFVKPREVAHDAGIYKMFQTEAALIESRGGRVRRVVLDFELKKRIYSVLGKSVDALPVERAKQQLAVAAANDLTVVDGKIPLPDLRIEYETSEGQEAHIDLELATEHYRRSQLAGKAQAGFKMYGMHSTSRGSRAEWEGRESSARILGL